MIVRDTQQLQELIQALPDGHDVNFRAIHEVASRIMQAAYDGWKKAELAKIAPRQHAPPPWRRRRCARWRASRLPLMGEASDDGGMACPDLRQPCVCGRA
jgi:hypothetical protein